MQYDFLASRWRCCLRGGIGDLVFRMQSLNNQSRTSFIWVIVYKVYNKFLTWNRFCRLKRQTQICVRHFCRNRWPQVCTCRTMYRASMTSAAIWHYIACLDKSLDTFVVGVAYPALPLQLPIQREPNFFCLSKMLFRFWRISINFSNSFQKFQLFLPSYSIFHSSRQERHFDFPL